MEINFIAFGMLDNVFNINTVKCNFYIVTVKFCRYRRFRTADFRIFFIRFKLTFSKLEIDGLIAHITGNGADKTNGFFKFL